MSGHCMGDNGMNCKGILVRPKQTNQSSVLLSSQPIQSQVNGTLHWVSLHQAQKRRPWDANSMIM